MAKKPINYYALGIDPLLAMNEADREYAQKVLKKQKRYAKLSKNLGTAQKVTKAAAKAPGLFSRLFGGRARTGDESEE